jgi:DNA-binding response OmpR family regulator
MDVPRLPPRVLLAEDDDLLRHQIARSIAEMGWTVSQAKDGRALIALLDACPHEARATVLVTDLRMPQVDGLDVLSELRARAVALPIVVITAFADDETRRAVRALGATILFSKPFDVDDLCTALAFLDTKSAI